MKRELHIRYSVEGYSLYPSDAFHRFAIRVQDELRHSVVVKRFGVLTRQLRPYPENLVLNPPTSSESISNDDLRIVPDYTQPEPIPEAVEEAADLIEKNVLNEDSTLLFNSKEFSEDAITSVYWLLNELRDEFSQRRKQAIGAYCRRTGLFETESDDAAEYRETNDQDGSKTSGYVTRPTQIRDNIELPDVSQL